MTNSLFKIEIDYPPDFKPRYGYGLPQAKYIRGLLKSKEREQLEFLSKIKGYKRNLSLICIDAGEESTKPRWNQDWFPPLDGMSMYTMIASNKPKTYIEIGSGNSTKFAAQAIRDHLLDTSIISVDPQPRVEVDNLCEKVIRKPLEEASELEKIISRLEPNDILFFDGSHRCLQNSDVTAFFIDYLPSMPKGVKIGIHDIFWPNDYPEHWLKRYYNEQYIVGTYMLALGSCFPLIFSCAYMGMNFHEDVCSCLDVELLSNLQKRGKHIGGGTLWFSKIMI